MSGESLRVAEQTDVNHYEAVDDDFVNMSKFITKNKKTKVKRYICVIEKYLKFYCVKKKKKAKKDDLKPPSIPGFLKKREGRRKAPPAGVETYRAGGEYSLTLSPSYHLHEELLPQLPSPPPPPPPPRYKLPKTPPLPRRKLPRDPSVTRSLPATPTIVRKTYSRHRDIKINNNKKYE